MSQSAKFIPVLSSIIDPELKLRATIEDRRIDTSDAVIRIYYDPLLESNRLTMPYIGGLKTARARLGLSDSPREIVFRSSKPQEIAAIPVSINIDNHNAMVGIFGGAREIDLISKTMETFYPPFFRKGGYNLLLDIIKSIIHIPNLVKDIIHQDTDSSTRIEIYISREAAEFLSRNTDFEFDKNCHSNVMIAARTA